MKFFIIFLNLLFSISLQATIYNASSGWNLLGAVDTIANTSALINSCGKNIYTYKDGKWTTHSKTKTGSVTKGQGFWIYTEKSCTIDTNSPTINSSSTPTSSSSLPNGINMINIQGGSFTMGGVTRNNDAPTVSVTLDSFKISESEITNNQYIEFLNASYAKGWIIVEKRTVRDPCGTYDENMIIGAGDAPNKGEVFLQLGESGGCTSKGEEESINNKSWITYNSSSNKFELIDSSKGNWPVNWVKWYGAYAFTKFYDVSLPTEAQWEYSARGGKALEYATDDGRISPSKANYNGDRPGVYNATGHSLAVKSYNPNPFGLYDMSGNVWEWCLDYYDASFYKTGTKNPLNSTANADGKRVRRGGSWNYHTKTLSTYARAFDFQNRGNNHFGFRIAK